MGPMRRGPTVDMRYWYKLFDYSAGCDWHCKNMLSCQRAVECGLIYDVYDVRIKNMNWCIFF